MFYLMTFQTKDTSSHFQDMSKLLPKLYIVLINTSESVQKTLYETILTSLKYLSTSIHSYMSDSIKLHLNSLCFDLLP